ncbi:MAG: QueT transporter family protein [Lachnospiraceae bacterium]
MKFNARFLATGGIIAAVYVVLTFVSAAMGLSSGVVQLRLSEALCILPCFTPAAILGLPLGCLLSNILTGGIIWDVVFGSLATLIGAVGTYMLRHRRFLASLPPIISNSVIIPFVLIRAYDVPVAYPLVLLSIMTGEFLSAGVLGQLLYGPLSRRTDLFG